MHRDCILLHLCRYILCMPKKIPSFEEFQDAVGEDAMSFFMDMVNQDDSRPDEETETPPEQSEAGK
jgi:hypothetical protein